MRVAVFSDTHGYTEHLPQAIALLGKVDAVLHLGDHCRDAAAIGQALGVWTLSVCGNCDPWADAPPERTVSLENARLYMTHGHLRSDPYRLLLKAKQERCSAALFGHTHIPFCEMQDSVLLLNPGSFSYPRGGYPPTFAVLDVQGDAIHAQLLSL